MILWVLDLEGINFWCVSSQFFFLFVCCVYKDVIGLFICIMIVFFCWLCCMQFDYDGFGIVDCKLWLNDVDWEVFIYLCSCGVQFGRGCCLLQKKKFLWLMELKLEVSFCVLQLVFVGFDMFLVFVCVLVCVCLFIGLDFFILQYC